MASSASSTDNALTSVLLNTAFGEKLPPKYSLLKTKNATSKAAKTAPPAIHPIINLFLFFIADPSSFYYFLMILNFFQT